MIRISISFPKDLYEELKKIATESERSLNRQVVFMLRNMVARRKKLNVPGDCWMVFSEEKKKKKGVE